MPLIQKDLREPHGFLGPRVMSYEIQHEVLPRRGSATADDPLTLAGLHQDPIGMQPHSRERV